MVWRLEMITRVLKYAPDDWDWSDPANEGKNPKVPTHRNILILLQIQDIFSTVFTNLSIGLRIIVC
jgi:hypothetical protein